MMYFPLAEQDDWIHLDPKTALIATNLNILFSLPECKNQTYTLQNLSIFTETRILIKVRDRVIIFGLVKKLLIVFSFS